MKKILNDPEEFVKETLDGILSAFPGELRSADSENRALVRADAPVDGKVAIVTGGGSGHLPLFLGYVGRGLCDGVAVGNVFSSPSPDQILTATRAVDGGAGVLYVYGNYSGDVLNFEAAAEMAALEGIETATVVLKDDVASARPERAERRRGVAGLILAYKVAGAAADRGLNLEAIRGITDRAAGATRTVGIAIRPCVLPTEGVPTFVLGEDEMEFGVGIHGEQGIARQPLARADAIADSLFDCVTEELPLRPGDEVAVLVNGMGATPLEELFVLYRRLKQRLDELKIAAHRVKIGEYVTSLEMAGCSLTMMRLDDELAELIDGPATAPLLSGW